MCGVGRGLGEGTGSDKLHVRASPLSDVGVMTWRIPTGESVGSGMLGAFLGVAMSGWVLVNVG